MYSIGGTKARERESEHVARMIFSGFRTSRRSISNKRVMLKFYLFPFRIFILSRFQRENRSVMKKQRKVSFVSLCFRIYSEPFKTEGRSESMGFR